MIVTRTADLERACAHLAAAQAPQLPLFRAVADRRIGLVTLGHPGNAWPAAELGRINRPAVVLVGDDPPDGHAEALGPMKWKAAERLRRWCRWVMVHAAGGEHDHYSAAVQAALLVGNVAVIETGTAYAKDWQDFLACKHTLLVIPRNGLPHPVRPEVVQ